MLSQYQAAPLRSWRSMLAVAVFTLAIAGSASAQALDPPTITFKGGGFFRIDLDVAAGASGAPHGFVVQWMKRSDYEALGFPADEYDPIAAYCDFIGAPTLNVDSRSASFFLDPNGVIGIQMGDLFDETGVNGSYLDQVHPGEYAFRAWAEGDGVNPNSGSLPSEVSFFSTVGKPECTQGFWKNHGSGACDNAAPHIDLWPPGCLPMTLGTVSYTEAELCAIYNTQAGGNGLISLAHQLITAKLNGCNGSDLTPIAATIAAADALIGGLVIPPIGGGFLAPSSTNSYTQTLDDYNNGIIPGVVSCATPTRHESWGRLKASYR